MLIIHASARSNGNTMQVCQQLQQELSADLIDLADYLGMQYGREWHSWINTEGKIGLIKERQ